MKKEEQAIIKKHIKKIIAYSHAEKQCDANQKLIKLAAQTIHPTTEAIINQITQQLQQVDPTILSNINSIIQQQISAIQPPAPQGEQAFAPPTGASQTGAPQTGGQSNPAQTPMDLTEAFNTIIRLAQTFLGSNNRQAAMQYPEVYNLILSLQKRLQVLLRTQLTLATTDVQQLDGLLASQASPMQQTIQQLIENTINQITPLLNNPNTSQQPVDTRIKFLNDTARNKPVTVIEPGGHGRPTPAVLVNISPSSVRLQTSQGRVILYERDHPQFAEVIESIQPLTLKERLNPLTQLKSLFHEKKKNELIKLADRLDLMGYSKQAQRIDNLVQKLS